MQMLGRECVRQRRELALALVREHPPLHRYKNFHSLLVLPRGGVVVGKAEKPRHSFFFLPDKAVQHFAGTLQISRTHERDAVGIEKRRVALGSREWLQQGRGADGVSGLQVCLGIEECDAALLWSEPVRAAQHIQRVGGGAARGGKLSGAQKRARRESIFPYAFGGLRKPQLPVPVFGIQLRNALPAKKRIFLAGASGEKLRRSGVLLDRFVGVILFLLQEGVARDALGRLRPGIRTQKPVIDREGFCLVLRINQQVKEQTVVHRRTLRLVHLRVQIAESLSGFLMLRRLIENG